MKLSIYKWSQYYLMYSPIWKHMIKSNYLLKYNNDNNKNGKQLVIKQFKELNQLNFNQRLSIAYQLLIQCESNQHKKKNENKMKSQDEQQLSYWSEQRDIIKQKFYQILTVANNKTHPQPIMMINQQIYKLFDELRQDDQQPKPSIDSNQQQQQQQSICSQKKQEQQPETNNRIQRKYKINELSKRIVINELVTLLFKRDKNVKSNESSNLNRVIQLTVVVKVLQYLFGNRLIGLEEEDLNDWLSVLLQQYSLFDQIKQKMNIMIINTIIGSHVESKGYPKYAFSEITSTLRLCKYYNSMIWAMEKFANRVKRSQKENRIQPELCVQLVKVVKAFNIGSQQKQGVLISCRQEIGNLALIQSLIEEYIKLIQGQTNNRNRFQTVYKQLAANSNKTNQQQQYQSDFTNRIININSNTNRKSNTNSQSKQQTRNNSKSSKIALRYVLWRLNQLISVGNQLKIIKRRFSIDMVDISRMMFNYLQQEIVNALELISLKLKIHVSKSISSHRNINKEYSLISNEQSEIEQIIYIGSLVREQLRRSQESKQQQDMWSNKLTNLLQRLNRECNTKILNMDIIDKNNQEQTISSTCIKLLYSLLNNYNDQTSFFHLNNNMAFNQQEKQQQLQQNNPILYYLWQTQLLHKLIKQLYQQLIQHKLHILLTQQQKHQLKSILTYLQLTNSKQFITLNSQLLSAIEKISQKL